MGAGAKLGYQDHRREMVMVMDIFSVGSSLGRSSCGR